ncbi:MAG TPA: hypothetical protein VNU97_15140 [Rhizomicrobium sp.]|jgi:hypothetical protein|nr:hypothetical protein [Rhizomicrobium sp.]
MSELGSTAADLRPVRFALPAAPLSRPLTEAAGTLLLSAMLLSVAVWNGFPIIFYDTGAYMLQGLGHLFIAERSPIYSGFLAVTGGAASLWFVAIAQCAVTGFVMVQFARAVRPELSLWALLGIGAALCLTTGLPWYAGQIEPDCFVAIAPLAIYVLAFHGAALGRTRSALLVAAAALATACHASHIALAAGLIAVIAGLYFAPTAWIEGNDLPRPRLLLAAASLALAVVAVFAANYAFTREIFFSRSGAIFLEARIMEDGLIAPVLDADCPRAGYAVCPYKDRLPSRADTWLWMANQSPFHRLGGFPKMEKESAALVAASLTRYPLENAIVGLEDAVLQFFWFQTGDGIVPQEWVLNREFKIAIPQQLNAYDRAYQQEGEIWFVPVNLVHVPVALLSLAALYLIARRVRARRDWRGGVLPAFVLLALLGNAFICGVFSGPHGRYQSRIMWLPTFAVLLIAWPEIEGELRRRFGAKPATG